MVVNFTSRDNSCWVTASKHWVLGIISRDIPLGCYPDGYDLPGSLLLLLLLLLPSLTLGGPVPTSWRKDTLILGGGWGSCRWGSCRCCNTTDGRLVGGLNSSRGGW